MNLKIKKASKHERKYLLKKAGSEGAFYPEKEMIVVDTTKSRPVILATVIHELGHRLGMNEKEAREFTAKCWRLTEK